MKEDLCRCKEEMVDTCWGHMFMKAYKVLSPIDLLGIGAAMRMKWC
jgi:hypothetical protein